MNRDYNSVSIDSKKEKVMSMKPIPVRFKESLFVHEIPPWKRAMDIVISLIGLIFLSPLLLLLSVFIKIVSPGPVFFKQKRVGYGEKLFPLFKFRTMKHNADTSEHRKYLSELIKSDENGGHQRKPMTKLSGGSQVIPLGKILRLSGFDELPQLFNVLRGDMSLIGPRPAIPYEVERRGHERFKVKDGAIAIPTSDLPKQGKIIDISKSGLAFCYKGNGDLSKKFTELSISMDGEDLNLDNIPCKTISDLTIADDSPPGSVSMKRCGVQFRDLNPKQTDQLGYFIENHTIST